MRNRCLGPKNESRFAPTVSIQHVNNNILLSGCRQCCGYCGGHGSWVMVNGMVTKTDTSSQSQQIATRNS
eukprot:scaffold57835_cov36-Cyclotella_meneghiniana.AAC.1